MRHVTKIERKSAKFIQSPMHVTMLNFRNICVSEFNHLLWRQLPPPLSTTAKLSTLPTPAPTPTDHLPPHHFNSTMIPAYWPPHLGLSVVLQPRLQSQCLPWAYTRRSSSRTGVTFELKGEFRRMHENVARMVDSDAVHIFRLWHHHWTAFWWTKDHKRWLIVMPPTMVSNYCHLIISWTTTDSMLLLGSF